MSSEWPYLRIGEIGNVTTGKTPSTSKPENFDGAFPFITIPDLGQGRDISHTARTISNIGAVALGNCKIPAKAVLMSCIATIGKTGITTKPSFTNQQINSVVCGTGVIPEFLYYVFCQLGPEIEEAGGGGSVFTNVSKSKFSDIRVPVPPLPVQKNIVNLLTPIDDRITLLRETNTTLEAIAQALFKSWFVDFDPVHAKMQGGAPEGMDEATAALLPDSFEESELGAVPKGWSLCPVYDLATFINGAAYKAFEPNAERRGLPIIKIAELKSGVSATTAFSAVDMPEKYLIELGDILFSWSGNPDTSIDTFVWPHEAAWLNQHIFRVLPNEEVERAFVLQTLRYLRPVFAELARNKQTTGLGHVTVADLKRLLVVKPDAKSLDLFNRIAGPVQQRIFENERLALSLSKLRDTLLPRLISGQLEMKGTYAG